jgi:predicted membrane protein
MEKLTKIILAILLLLCLLDMPYGFYQFVRFAAMVGFGYLAYSAKERNRKNEMFIYIALAFLFQPFMKIALGRTIWNIVDVITAIGLLVSALTDDKKLKTK